MHSVCDKERFIWLYKWLHSFTWKFKINLRKGERQNSMWLWWWRWWCFCCWLRARVCADFKVALPQSKTGETFLKLLPDNSFHLKNHNDCSHCQMHRKPSKPHIHNGNAWTSEWSVTSELNSMLFCTFYFLGFVLQPSTVFSTSSRPVFYLNSNFSSEALNESSVSQTECALNCVQKSHKNEFSIRMHAYTAPMVLALVFVLHLSAWIRVRMPVPPLHFT